MPHGLHCHCNLCSARGADLSCAAIIIQRRFRLRAYLALVAAELLIGLYELEEPDRLAAARRGDCFFCIICTLPQGECDLCRDC